MSDDLKINLSVPDKVPNQHPTDDGNQRRVSQSDSLVESAVVSSGAQNPQEQRQPSLRPSPISGVTPPVHTRWKKGESGNPGGRCKHVSRAYIKHLETVVDEATGETNADKIAQAQIKKATLVFDPGSTAAAREIRQATETDDEANKGGGFNIGSLNVAILNQIQRAATGKELE